METLKIAKINVKMIAHRGLSGLERENTMASFIAANNRSYYGTECDIHLTKDNHFVICHDDKTGRVSNTDLVIQDSTLEEVQSIRLYGYGTNETRSYLMIPTLDEYLECAKKYDKKCIIEVKCELNSKTAAELLAIINQHEYHDNVIFISFILENLKKLRRLDKQIPLQLLISNYSEEIIDVCKKYKLDLDIHYKALTVDRIAELHDANIQVNAWTVDNPIDALMLVTWGVDFITSNILE